MSLLGDYLEMLYGPAETFKTIQGTVRHWRDDDVAAKASATQGRTGGRAKSPSPAGISESHLRIWVSLPDKARVE